MMSDSLQVTYDEKDIFCDNCRVIKIYYYKPTKSVKCRCETVEEDKQIKLILETNPVNRINLIEDLSRWKYTIPKILAIKIKDLESIQNYLNIEKALEMISFIINLLNLFKDDFLALLNYLDKNVLSHFKHFNRLAELREFMEDLKLNPNGKYEFSHIEGDPKLEALSVRLGLFLAENDENFGENKFIEEVCYDMGSKIESTINKSNEFIIKLLLFLKFISENKLIPLKSYDNQAVVSSYESLHQKLDQILKSGNNIKPNIMDSSKYISYESSSSSNEMKKIQELNEQISALTEMKNKYELQIMKYMEDQKKLAEENKNMQTRLKVIQDEYDTVYFQINKIKEMAKIEIPSDKNKSSKEKNNRKFLLCLETLNVFENNYVNNSNIAINANSQSSLNMSATSINNNNSHNRGTSEENNKNVTIKSVQTSKTTNQTEVIHNVGINKNISTTTIIKVENTSNINTVEIKKYKEQLLMLQEILVSTQQENQNYLKEITNLEESKSAIEVELNHFKSTSEFHEQQGKNLLQMIVQVNNERVQDYEIKYTDDIEKPDLNASDNIYENIKCYIVYVAKLDRFYYKLHKLFEQTKSDFEALKLIYENHIESQKRFKNDVFALKKKEDEKFADLNINYLLLQSKFENYFVKYQTIEKELIKERIKNTLFTSNITDDETEKSHITNLDLKDDEKAKRKLRRKVIKKEFLKEYEKCLKDLESQNNSISELKENYESQIKSLTEKIKTLQSSGENSKNPLEEFLVMKNKFLQEKVEIEQQIISLTNEVAYLKKKESDAKDHYSFILKENNQLKANLKIDNNPDINIFNNIQCSVVNNTVLNYRSEIDHVKLHQYIKSLLDEKEKIVAELFKFYGKYDSMLNQKNMAVEESQNCVNQIKGLRKEIMSLKNHLETQESTKKNLERLEKENCRLRELLEKKKEELILDFNAENNLRGSLVGAMEGETDDLSLLKTSNLNLNLRLNNLKDVLLVYETENEYLKHKIQHKNTEIEQLRNKATELDSLRLEVLSFKSKNLTFMNDIKTLKNEISYLQNKFQAADIECLKLKSEIQASENSFNKQNISNIYPPQINTYEINSSKILNISNDNLNFDYNVNYNIIKTMNVEKNEFDFKYNNYDFNNHSALDFKYNNNNLDITNPSGFDYKLNNISNNLDFTSPLPLESKFTSIFDSKPMNNNFNNESFTAEKYNTSNRNRESRARNNLDKKNPLANINKVNFNSAERKNITFENNKISDIDIDSHNNKQNNILDSHKETDNNNRNVNYCSKCAHSNELPRTNNCNDKINYGITATNNNFSNFLGDQSYQYVQGTSNFTNNLNLNVNTHKENNFNTINHDVNNNYNKINDYSLISLNNDNNLTIQNQNNLNLNLSHSNNIETQTYKSYEKTHQYNLTEYETPMFSNVRAYEHCLKPENLREYKNTLNSNVENKDKCLNGEPSKLNSENVILDPLENEIISKYKSNNTLNSYSNLSQPLSKTEEEKINQIVKETTGGLSSQTKVTLPNSTIDSDINTKFSEIDKIYNESISKLKALGRSKELNENLSSSVLSLDKQVNRSKLEDKTGYKTIDYSKILDQSQPQVQNEFKNEKSNYNLYSDDIKDILKRYCNDSISNNVNNSTSNINSTSNANYNPFNSYKYSSMNESSFKTYNNFFAENKTNDHAFANSGYNFTYTEPNDEKNQFAFNNENIINTANQYTSYEIRNYNMK